jgi:hypothetical protein
MSKRGLRVPENDELKDYGLNNEKRVKNSIFYWASLVDRPL